MHRIPRTLDEVIQDGHDIVAVCRDPDCRHSRYVDLRRVIGRLGGRTPLLPQAGKQHYSDRMRCPACKGRGMFVWFQPKVEVSKPRKQPNYIVVDRGSIYPFDQFNIIATADNLMVARGGYNAAAMFYHNHEITLQQGTYIIMDSRRDGLPKPLTLHNYKEMREMEQALNSASANEEVDQQLNRKSLG